MYTFAPVTGQPRQLGFPIARLPKHALAPLASAASSTMHAHLFTHAPTRPTLLPACKQVEYVVAFLGTGLARAVAAPLNQNYRQVGNGVLAVPCRADEPTAPYRLLACCHACA